MFSMRLYHLLLTMTELHNRPSCIFVVDCLHCEHFLWLNKYFNICSTIEINLFAFLVRVRKENGYDV